jgi:hypothetical protein
MAKTGIVALAALAAALGAGAGRAGDDGAVAPWLDVPAGWTRAVDGGVLAVTPDDLRSGEVATLLVEPPGRAVAGLAEAYQAATGELGRWRPIADPVEQRLDGGWVFRHGVGVVTRDDGTFVARVAIARRGAEQVRFWAIAGTDELFNRYQDRFNAAIASAQGMGQGAAAARSAPATAPTPAPAQGLPPGYGTGLSGLWAGLERGLSASAGVAAGPRQQVDPATGRISTSTTGAAPTTVATLVDFETVELILPDGTFRRGLPQRGLASDLAWDRANRPTWWGRWRRDGDGLVMERGGSRTRYRVDGERLVSDRDRAWAKLPRMGATRLDGVFGRADLRRADAPTLVLRADGTWEDRGGFLRMIGSSCNLVVPDGDTMVSRWTDEQYTRAMSGGAGTYTYEDYTLTLRGRDGRVWQLGTWIPSPERPPAAGRLVMNTRQLVRVGDAPPPP